MGFTPNAGSTRVLNPASAQSGSTGRHVGRTTVGSVKNEVVGRQGPWWDVNQFELATLEWVVWFKHRTPARVSDDFAPGAVDKLHDDHKRTPLVTIGHGWAVRWTRC